jgi:hypothetical protein
MFSFARVAAIGIVAASAPAAAVTTVHIDSIGIYSPGTVQVTRPDGTVTDYAAAVRFTGTSGTGTAFDLLGFCVDLFHSIAVGIGGQRATSLDYHRAGLTTDANGSPLTSAQARQIGGLADLGFGIAVSDPERSVKLAAIQQAIWTIEYPTFTFDGSGSPLAGQQAYADAYVAAAPGLKGTVRAIYADDLATQGFVVAGVPEPASWALMIAGFGLVGVSARRRTSPATVAA